MDNTEIECPECKGSGFVDPTKVYTIAAPCKKCQGTGKLDWVEKICGKKIPDWEVNLNKMREVGRPISEMLFDFQQEIMNDFNCSDLIKKINIT